MFQYKDLFIASHSLLFAAYINCVNDKLSKNPERKPTDFLINDKVKKVIRDHMYMELYVNTVNGDKLLAEMLSSKKPFSKWKGYKKCHEKSVLIQRGVSTVILSYYRCIQQQWLHFVDCGNSFG